MTTRILLTVSTVVFVGIIGYAYLSLPHKGSTTTPTITITTTPQGDLAATRSNGSQTTGGNKPTSGAQSGGAQSSGITMAMVAKHSSASSCWTAVSGKVYDLTSWIDQHPGGPGPILSLCGTDGTAAFNAQHGGQGRPANELANFYIGPLAN